MLFHKKTKKALNVVWIILTILMILGMILLYTPFGSR